MTEAGQKENVRIHAIAYGGDGVAKLSSGMTVFVPFTAVEDEVCIELTEVHSRFARGRIMNLLHGGPDRINPVCPYFGQCGGCQYQHISDSVELQLKARQLEETLRRVGRLQGFPTVEVPCSEAATLQYRNRITLHPTPSNKPGNEWGFFATDNTTVQPVNTCPIATPVINRELQHKSVSPSHDRLLLRSDAAGNLHRLYGIRHADDRVTERLLGRDLSTPLGGFYQVHPQVLDSMADWLQKALHECKCEALLDAYCGCGVFSLALSGNFKESLGIESNAESITSALDNAHTWNVKHAAFQAGNVEELLDQGLQDLQARANGICVLLDPPRKGCADSVLKVLHRHQPETIVYIACDPVMLARDLARLEVGKTWRMDRLACFNMFPQTAHFESIAILCKV